MQYRQFPPIAELERVLHCVWTLEGEAGSGTSTAPEPIVPDGRAELVVHFGDAFERILPGTAVVRQPAVMLAGQLTEALLLRPTGRVAVLGLRFHSYGAAALFPEPQRAFVGQTIGIDEVSAPLHRALREIREAAASLTDAAERMQRELARRFTPTRIDPRIASAVRAIERRAGRVSIERLAASAGVTRRQLERRFNEIVGLSPKRLARIVRLQHALRLLEDADRPAGAHAATMSGYADQAHFVRECRELCGYSPGAHLLESALLTRIFMA